MFLFFMRSFFFHVYAFNDSKHFTTNWPKSKEARIANLRGIVIMHLKAWLIRPILLVEYSIRKTLAYWRASIGICILNRTCANYTADMRRAAVLEEHWGPNLILIIKVVLEDLGQLHPLKIMFEGVHELLLMLINYYYYIHYY